MAPESVTTPEPELPTTIPPVPEMTPLTLIFPEPLAFSQNQPESEIVPETVSRLAVALISVPLALGIENPRVKVAVFPVYVRFPLPLNITALVALPRLLAPPETTILLALRVPPVMVVVPV